MKTASQLLQEIILAVQPPRGIAIALTDGAGNPNWIAGAGIMDAERTRAFTAQVAKLRQSDPAIDWSSVTELDGDRGRIARWLSEVQAQ
jgi:hypothetical protein